MTSKSATAAAHANIALIKYWGKRDSLLNLPASGSISLTLKALQTTTRVAYPEDLEYDQLTINDAVATGGELVRIQQFMNLIRKEFGFSDFASIKSSNNFPTGAGLASSASAFAALSLAATAARGIKLNPRQLSILSRKGSGSAARSVFGGYVEMKTGVREDGSEDYAEQIKPAGFWDLRVLILITSSARKKVGSTDAMKISAASSPYYEKWITSSTGDLQAMRKAILSRNFEDLGALAEHNALKMHAVMISSVPSILYWNRTTVDLMHFVHELRRQGVPAYFTIDAGPQIKVITLPAYVSQLKKEFESFPDIETILESRLGDDVRLIKER